MNYDIVLRVVDKTSAGLKKTEQGISKVSKSAKLAKGALAGVGIAIGGIVAAGATVKKTIDSFDELAKRARNVGAASQASFEQFQVVDQMLKEAGLSSSEVDRSMRQLNLRLEKGSKGGAAYADAFGKLGKSVYDANGELKQGPAAFQAVAEAVQNGSLSLEEASSLMGRSVGPKIVGTLRAAAAEGRTVEQVMKDVKANSNIVDLDAAKNAEAFNDTMSRVTNVLGQLMTDAVTPLLPLLNELANDLLANMPAIVENVKGAFERMQPMMNAMGTLMTELVIPALKLLWDGFMVLMDVIGPIYETAIPLIVEGFQLFGEAISKVINAVNSFIEGITNIGAQVEQVGENFVQIGDNIIQGVIEGIKNGVGFVKDAVKNMASGAIDSAKEFFGINSPSRVFMEIGDFLMQGLAKGLDDNQGKVDKSLDNTAKSVKGKATEISNNLSSAISSGLSDGKLELNDFKGFFMDTLASLATQAMGGAGGMGGTAGGLGGIAASIAGSLFFADGGQIQAGKAGIVGEAGPELVKGPATVYSNSETKGMLGGSSGGGDNITYAPVFQTTINPGDKTSPEDAEKFAAQFNSTIEAKVTDTIIKMQNRRGAFQEARPY